MARLHGSRCLELPAVVHASWGLAGIYGPAAALPALGCRAASTGGGGGSTAKERAVGYLREKERQATAAADGDSSAAPRSRLAEAAAEFSEAQQAFLLSSPSGLGAGAEAAIAQAIKEGALDNLTGRGKPLQQEDHGAQFHRVDPLVQAVTRTMGAQNLRPLSLDLREELHREQAALRSQLQAELKAALAAEASRQGGREAAAASSCGGERAGWLGRLFGAGSSGGDSGSSVAARRRHSVPSIRAGQHPGLQHAAEKVEKLVQEYNAAALSDKETWGAFWPLNPARKLDWGAEVDAALAAVQRDAGSGDGGSCNGSKAGGNAG